MKNFHISNEKGKEEELFVSTVVIFTGLSFLTLSHFKLQQGDILVTVTTSMANHKNDRCVFISMKNK